MKLNKIARILAIITALCMLPIGAIPATATTTVADPPDGVDYTPKTVWSDDFSDGNLDGWTHRVEGFAVTEDNGNKVLHAASTETTGGATIQTQNDAFKLKDKNFTFRFKIKMAGGEKGFAPLNATFGNYTTAKGQNVGFSGAGLGMDMGKWYEWAYVYSYDAEGTGRTDASGNAVTGTQTLDIWSRYQNQDGTWSAWTENVSDMAVATYQGTATLIKFTFGTIGGNQLATDVWYDDFKVYLHEEDTTTGGGTEDDGDNTEDDDTSDVGPDGVDYTPKTVWSDDFSDGNLDGWVAINGVPAMTASDGAMHGEANSGMRYNSDDLKLGGKNYSFGFKAKISGHGTNPGRINVQSYFDTNKRISTYIGFANHTGTFAMADGTWYEFMYVYTYDEGTATQTADLYAREQGSDSSWSDWELLQENIALTDTNGTGRLEVYLEAITAARQNATDVWYDDFKVYLHEEDTTGGGSEDDDDNTEDDDTFDVGPDGVDYEPNMIFEEYFDGGATRWTGADSATFENGAIKLGKDSAITYADDKFGDLDDKSFTFRFKTKVSGNTSADPNKNWVRPELGFGSKQWIATYLGYNSDSVLAQDTWYEFLYDYSPATTENASTGYQSATIYYRTSADKETWSAWQTAKTVTETAAPGSTNKIKLSFSFIASNQATIVWYDDIQVYIHEPKPTTPDPGPGTDPDDPVVPDEPDEQEKTESKIYWQEDFSDGVADGFTKPSDSGVMMEVADGTLHGAVTDTVSAGAVYTSSAFGELATKDFNFRFKVKLKEMEGQNQSYLDIQTSFGTDTRLRTLIGYNNIDFLSETWYEIFYAYDYNTATKALTCDIYARHQTGADTWSNWTTVATDQAAGSSSYDNMLRFYLYGTNTNGCKATDIWLDDFIVYTGDIVVLDAPVIAGNEVTVGGRFCIGNPGQAGAAGLTMMAAIYDTKNKATVYPATEVFELQRGSEEVKSKTFIMPALKSNQEMAVFAWDSIENGQPLSKVTGYIIPNQASDTAEPEDKEQPYEIDYAVSYNKISLTGFIGRKGVMTASLTDSEGKVCAILQTDAAKYGMMDTDLILDAKEFDSGEYTLRVNYGGEENLTETVTLSCEDSRTEMPITNQDSYQDYVETYGSSADAAIIEDAAAAGYDYYTILAKGGFADYHAFRNALEESVKAKGFLDTINAAVLAEDWFVIEELVTNDAKVYLQVPDDIFEGVGSVKKALGRLTGGYDDNKEVLADIKVAVAAQKKAEAKPKLPGGGGGGGGGGGAGAGFVGFPGEEVPEDGTPLANQEQIVVPGGPNPAERVELVDLGNVPWAEKEILALQKMDIIKGAGDGYFYPDNSVTREEFLKMAIMAADIEVDTADGMPFADVDPNAWYYDYVAAAYQCGIINGVSDAEFGIGEKITRADMAVMMSRILDYLNITIEPTIPAFVFDDFKDIPDYATESISNLCRVEVMNGMGDNLFMPMNSATRAESAVLVYRIFNYINERR